MTRDTYFLPPWWRTAALVLGLGFAANGLFMLAAPADWYLAIPGVIDTGPPNRHFIGDIGGAYLASGLGLGLAARWALLAPGASLVAAAFHGLHSLVHVTDAFAGRCSPGRALADIGPVHGPTLLCLLLAVVAIRRRL
ncbi:hypothetical protein [Zavarzinia sp.]|uniref:hypothetical protein n=1 Tax=Zavarzinia sp. TaxID=2027920 RepID=UPI00356293DC